jgi:hypothetical protein
VSEPTSSAAGPPAEISHLVRERAEARARRDWSTADALKDQIEALGWRVTDHGRRTSVSQAAPATLEVAGEIRYGSASVVPSALAEPATTAWTVAIVASESPDRVSRLLAGLRAHAPAGTQVVVVANDPSEAQAAALQPGAPDRAPIGGGDLELLRTSTRLGAAAAFNMCLRRASGKMVLLADGSAWPAGDALTPLAAELADPSIAAVGGFGLVSPAGGPLKPGSLERDGDPAPRLNVVALEAGWLAFRRAEYRALGPLDERFVTPAWLDVWWTLRLRVGAEPADPATAETTGEAGSPEAGAEAEATAMAEEAGSPEAIARADPMASPGDPRALPRALGAVRLALPLAREEAPWPPDRSRLNRRNMYRVLDRFGWREDLG